MANHETAQGGLPVFLRFAKDYRVLVTHILGLGSAPVILDWIFLMGPPWPHSRGTALVTSLVIWLVLVWTYGTHGKRNKTATRRLIKISATLAFVGLVVYLALWANYVKNAPHPENREAIGFVLKPESREWLNENRSLCLDDLFERAEYKPERICPEWSVNAARLSLMGAWLFTFASMSFALSWFLLLLPRASPGAASHGRSGKRDIQES